MTDKEKAKRYDALIEAIKFTRDIYGQLAKENNSDAEKLVSDHDSSSALMGYYTGKAATFELVSKEMDKWVTEDANGIDK